MQTAATQVTNAPIHQRRAHKRYEYSAPCSIRKDHMILVASVNNISKGGINVKLEQLGAMQAGKTITLTIGTFDPISAVIRWNEGSVYGMQFLTPATSHPQLSKVIDDLSDKQTA